MNILITLGIIALSSFLSYILKPAPPRQAPPAVGEVSVPTVDSTSPKPKVYGTVWLKQANVVWYGHISVVPIRERSDSGGKK